MKKLYIFASLLISFQDNLSYGTSPNFNIKSEAVNKQLFTNSMNKKTTDNPSFNKIKNKSMKANEIKHLTQHFQDQTSPSRKTLFPIQEEELPKISNLKCPFIAQCKQSGEESSSHKYMFEVINKKTSSEKLDNSSIQINDEEDTFKNLRALTQQLYNKTQELSNQSQDTNTVFKPNFADQYKPSIEEESYSEKTHDRTDKENSSKKLENSSMQANGIKFLTQLHPNKTFQSMKILPKIQGTQEKEIPIKNSEESSHENEKSENFLQINPLTSLSNNLSISIRTLKKIILKAEQIEQPLNAIYKNFNHLQRNNAILQYNITKYLK